MDGNESSLSRRTVPIVRFLTVLTLLYLFLVAIEMMGASFKAVGRETAENLLTSFGNPFAGLFVGVLATVLVQSSSVTTATIVALVGSGQLPLPVAVPMVMGANIGTTVTNTLVALGHVGRKDDFRRAFAGATVHDFFNLMTVAVLLPMELLTGWLQKSAHYLTQWVPEVGAKLPNPLKTGVKWSSEHVQHFLEETCALQGGYLAAILFVMAIAMIVASLYFITKNMKYLMATRIEKMLNRVLGRSGILGLLIGILMTVAVQSSSITTSLLIPLFGAGLLQLRAGLPIMIGANIGTTITALLAATVTDVAGLEIALVHLLFNLCGTALVLPWKVTRDILIWLAESLAEAAVKNKLWVLGYVFVVFVLVPVLGILFFHLFT